MEEVTSAGGQDEVGPWGGGLVLLVRPVGSRVRTFLNAGELSRGYHNLWTCCHCLHPNTSLPHLIDFSS